MEKEKIQYCVRQSGLYHYTYYIGKDAYGLFETGPDEQSAQLMDYAHARKMANILNNCGTMGDGWCVAKTSGNSWRDPDFRDYA